MLARKYKGIAGLVAVFIGIMVAIIIAVSVVIPTIDDVMSSQSSAFTNYSSAQTLINLAPLLIAVVLILAIVGIMRIS